MRMYKCAEKAHSANKRADGSISASDVLNVLYRSDFKCTYCGKKLGTKKWELDHFYACARGGKNHPNNLAASCDWCNRMKGALDGWAFIERCAKISENNLLKSLFNNCNQTK